MSKTTANLAHLSDILITLAETAFVALHKPPVRPTEWESTDWCQRKAQFVKPFKDFREQAHKTLNDHIETTTNVLTRDEVENLCEAWCQDLEKNADKQGKGLLHAVAEDGEETFCCLGRLCVVAKEKYGDRLGITSILEETIRGDFLKYGVGGQDDGEIIHESLREKIGLRTDGGEIIFPATEDCNEPYQVALTEINDDGKTFPEIAQLIREHKGELFPMLGETSH